MTSRLDRLVLLLHTGSTPAVRQTAARQLGDVQKQHPHELPNLMSRVLQHLRSKQWETRVAAGQAIEAIALNVASWQPSADADEMIKQEMNTDDVAKRLKQAEEKERLSFATFDISEVMRSGRQLLASAGKEYDIDLAGLDPQERLAAQRRDLKRTLGMGSQFMDVDLMDEADLNITVTTPKTSASASPAPTAAATATPPASDLPDPLSNPNLSKRELNALKRRLKQKEKSKAKVRVLDSKSAVPVADSKRDTVVTKMDVTEQPGSQKIAVESHTAVGAAPGEDGRWPFEAVCDILSHDLFDPTWEVRHGAGIGLRSILKVHGSGIGMIAGVSNEVNQRLHRAALEDLAVRLLCVFALDRFGDFVSDQVVAPVRETCAQALGTVLQHVSIELANTIFQQLMCLVHQPDNREKIWQVRHAGLLGLKYAVAVRKDCVEAWIHDTVNAAIIGLGDVDDDVRAVSASVLIPVVDQFVTHCPDRLLEVVRVLWNGMRDVKDDLSASTASIMDLVAKLFSFDVVLFELQRAQTMHPDLALTNLVPCLLSFFRHTIRSVRLAVLRTISTFLSVPQLDKSWVNTALLQMVWQNMLLEEKEDILELSLQVWSQLMSYISKERRNELPSMVHGQLAVWLHLLLTPIGVPLDTSLVVTDRSSINPAMGGTAGASTSGHWHNVDAAMLQQDLSLVSYDVVLRARITTASALGQLLAAWPAENNAIIFKDRLIAELNKPSALSRRMISILLEEWAMAAQKPDMTELLLDTSELAQACYAEIISLLENPNPEVFSELRVAQQQLYIQCHHLLKAFVEAGVPPNELPTLPTQLSAGHVNGTADLFDVNFAENLANVRYKALLAKISGSQKKTQLATLGENHKLLLAAKANYCTEKEALSMSTQARLAGTAVAFGRLPAKLNPIIRALINSIKQEENEDLQQRTARSMSRLLQLCVKRSKEGRGGNPADKVIKNICSFLCADTAHTPVLQNDRRTSGIISLDTVATVEPPAKRGRRSRVPIIMPTDETPEAREVRLIRRGAEMAIREIAQLFGPHLFDELPKLWECASTKIIAAFPEDPNLRELEPENESGQEIIDALQLIVSLAPQLDASLHHRFESLVDNVVRILGSRFAVIRHMAARALAVLCDVLGSIALQKFMNQVLPFLGDANDALNRQGAIEAVSALVETLDESILPYVIFLLVPVLGRMSDPDNPVRLAAANCFAQLIKLVPLEAGIPDPPGFSEDLIKQRDEERRFLAQLMDISKLEMFKIPVKINAELRKYQQEGVNWIMFLNRYHLHGILCDDMGLGKTLQSICCLASDHHFRAERYAATKSPEFAPLPSLVVCPPTLTGHWAHEIKTFVDTLSPLIYSGPPADRANLQSEFKKHDVIIMSYDILRNDIEQLASYNWNYCILDEGHMIKNAKAKLTLAVKRIKANHRLILSGTPIQNNVLELWSLFDFLMPGFLGTERQFNERFGKPILASRDSKTSSKEQEAGALALEALHKQVLPFLLRRLKEDVLSDLPPKIIQDYYCELSYVQKQLYEDFARSQTSDMLRSALSKGSSEYLDDDNKSRTHIFQALQYLRKLCNHPLLVFDSKHPRYDQIMQQVRKDGQSLHDLTYAPKLQALKQLLLDCGIGAGSNNASPTGEVAVSPHRALIFCQLKTMLDIVEKDLLQRHMPSVTYLRMDGAIDAERRHAMVQQFNADPSIDVFLLTTHVGGLGLNLTGADTVIFVEHDWNPMKDLQAMDRAHRIGQKRVVNVYRLITRGTLEEKIMGLQKFKLNIANSVINQQNSGLQSMGTDQILDLFNIDDGSSGETEANGRNKQNDTNRPASLKAALEDLENLWDERQYEEEYNLDQFIQSLR